MASSVTSFSVPSNPLGWIPEIKRFNDSNDSTEIETKVVNVSFDGTKGNSAVTSTPFQLSATDNGSLVRLDLSQVWADPIFASASVTSPVTLKIQLPPVIDNKPCKFDFDFSMLDKTKRRKLTPHIKIQILPHPAKNYTYARFTGGCAVFTANSSVNMATPFLFDSDSTVLTPDFTDEILEIKTNNAETGVPAVHLASSQLSISTAGMGDWTKYDSNRYSNGGAASAPVANGDFVYWNVKGTFFGKNLIVDFVAPA